MANDPLVSSEALKKILGILEEKSESGLTQKQLEAVIAIVEAHEKNPKAIEAWVWLYDTAERFKSVGVFLTGFLKWSLIFVATLIAWKNGGEEVIREFLKWIIGNPQ